MLFLKQLFFSLLALIPFEFVGQIGTGQWFMHSSPRLANGIALGNDKIMVSLEQGLLEYDLNSEESRVLNRINSLSDISVSAVFFHSETGSFYIGYANGNIDVINSSGAVTNIPAIKLATLQGSKKINRFRSKGMVVYALSSFGVVSLNAAKLEVIDTFYPNGSIGNLQDFSIVGDSIFVSASATIKKAALFNPILADENQWIVDSRFPSISTGQYSHLEFFENQHYVAINNLGPADTVFRLDTSGLSVVFGGAFQLDITSLTINFEHLVLTDAYYATFYKAGVATSISSYGSVPSSPRGGIIYNGFYWIADAQNGLIKYNPSLQTEYINLNGLPQKSIFSIESFENKQIVSAGILDRVVPQFKQEGAYVFNNGEWSQTAKFNGKLLDTPKIFDISTAAINPKNTDQVYLAGYNQQPLIELDSNGSGIAYFDETNSALEKTSLGNQSICISDLEFDDNENLWIANGYSSNPLCVKKADGSWLKFNTGPAVKNAFTQDLVIDYNGNKWMSVYGVGMLGFNDNKTIDNTSDDLYKVFKVGEGAGNLPSDNVTAIAVDFDNEIWVGTDQGLRILYNSNSALDAPGNTDLSEILINFEGEVESFLTGTNISDIEIDGGNRKWLATEGAGLFLISADGQTIISHFTNENSPLISNSILDIDFNQTTGELFIITDKGLISYRADASYEDPDYENVIVFPNPVRPNFYGPITIQGIRYDSDVKVTDVSGNLVYKTTSNGGTATWDGKNLNGTDVASGMYFIWTATNTKSNGKNKKVGKVAIIR
jgi:hypothetical protein